MKIRIKGNTIRFRLTKTEVDTLCKEGYIEEITDFGDRTFSYAVQRSAIPSMEATFSENKLTLAISEDKVTNWETNQQVGFEHAMPVGDNKTLELLLEKDFACLDERLEDQSDNYPNPKALES
jgi:hypothetical protein